MARNATPVSFFTDYEDQSDQSEELIIPEDLTTLSAEEVTALHDRAFSAFAALYGNGKGLSPEDSATLTTLTEGIEALAARKDELAAEDDKRAEEAGALAAKIGFSVEDSDEDPEEDDAEEEEDSEDGDEAEVDAEELEEVTASTRGELRVNLSGVKQRKKVQLPTAKSMKDITFSPTGEGMTKMDMAKSINKKLNSFNHAAYRAAARSGKKMGERIPIATLNRSFSSEARVTDETADDAIKFAINESNLPGGSLVASGGWCAPSQTVYELCNISEAANLISLPEIQINRGGIRFTTGPDYATVYGDTGFCFTEQDDIDSDYDGDGGPKPCFHVECADFDEERLGACGICITAGLLQAKGYPELIENTIDLALKGHAHRVSASVINSLVAKSTAVTLPSPQVGATAPLLTAIDLQATHYRAINRMSDRATLEVVLPTWTRLVIRTDLARRLGVDLISVPDERIDSYFRNLKVNVQFVVDWQDIATTPASGFVSAPTSVKFLLYAAGTFVKGSTDSITFENVYDSVGLGTNDYTALFTEDPFLVAKRCHDSRVVTVPICANGAANLGLAIDCDGTTV